MKSTVLTLIAVSLFSCVFSQSKPLRKLFPDMVFVQGGSFQSPLDNATITLASFYLSKEVTNKEYKEFINDIKQNPDKKLIGKRILRKLSNGEFRDSTPIIQYNEVANSIIDTTQFPVGDYFTNASYDNYPVIGVSNKHAKYYAAWKTRKNSEKSEKGKLRPQYDSLTDAQKDYLAFNSVQNKSKERILLDERNKGNFQGFYLVIYSVTSVKRTASLK